MADERLIADDLDCDVAIIGYGPVGATLAGLLARRGVRTTVIDREADVYPLPRAAHVDHEILRILQELGCADEMFAGMRPNQGMDFLTADHQVLLSMRSPGVTALGWPASVFINQPLFEAQLRATVAGLGAVTQLGSGVASIETVDSPERSGDHVRLTLDDGSSLTARYVVGAMVPVRSPAAHWASVRTISSSRSRGSWSTSSSLSHWPACRSSPYRYATPPDPTRSSRCPNRAFGSSSCCFPGKTRSRCRHPMSSRNSRPAGCPTVPQHWNAAPSTRSTD